MNRIKKINYTEEPIGRINLLPDFLPEPRDLVLKEETIKVTLSLTKESIDFFKQAAKTHHTNYQRMIRQLLEQYAAHYTDTRKIKAKK